ncbi:MAG: class I SAM-dependent methyltransferase [Candidatus Methanoperedens sp.]|nr:class I SAM-dependent methyltransferase [Candidatus Methanoperedens sp.]
MENCIEFPEAIEYSLLKKIRLPIILDFMETEENDIILDVGSGGGYFIRNIAKKSKLVIGLDMSLSNTKNAKRSIGHGNICFVIGDATRSPFKKEVFDKILATEIIEHIENDKLFIEECERTLKNRGHIVITTPCTNPTLSLDWLRKISGVNIKEDFGHVRGGYTKNNLDKLLNQTKFKIIRVSYFSQFFAELSKIFTYLGRTIHSDSENWTSGRTQSKLIGTRSFRLYKFFFPILYQFSKLDKLLNMFKGHHIIIKASKTIK